MTVFIHLFPLLQNLAIGIVVVVLLSNFVPAFSFVHSSGFKLLSLAVFIAAALLSLAVGFWVGALIWGLNAVLALRY